MIGRRPAAAASFASDIVFFFLYFLVFFFKKIRFFIAASLLFSAAGPAFSQWNYSACPDVTIDEENFKTERLIDPIELKNDPDMLEPIKMALHMTESGEVDIFYVRRHGSVNHYAASTGDVKEIALLEPGTQNEDGLVGIVLDPKFQENGWIYLYYSIGESFRVGRFNYYTGPDELDVNSEVVILDIPSIRNRWHTGGALQFDAYGDLWITVGDNEAQELGPANTADLRGKILRIHPHEDGSYSIPKGNLWEYAARLALPNNCPWWHGS